MVNEYLKYTDQPKYSKNLVKLAKCIVIELCIIAGCFVLEFWVRTVDPVSGNHGPDLWIFAAVMPILLSLYYWMPRNSGKYYATLEQIYDHVIIIPDQKHKKFKAITCFQVEHIPNDIVVKEKRIRKKTIEKLSIPGSLQYIHDHLTLMAEVVPALAFEISVKENAIKIRMYNFLVSSDKDSLIEKIEILKQFTVLVFQIVFPGMQLKMLHGDLLMGAWADVVGGYRDNNYTVKRNSIEIEHHESKQFMAILKMTTPPKFLNLGSRDRNTQIGELIKQILGFKLDFHYIVSAESSQISVFSNLRKGLGQFKLTLEESVIHQQLQTIRNTEMTGKWNVSCYVVVRSENRENLNADIAKVQSIFTTQFGCEASILNSKSIKESLPRIAERAPLTGWYPLTSESLAVWFHFPVWNPPTMSGSKVPRFDVPPEREIDVGIPIGQVLLNDQIVYPFNLSLENLLSPILIAGDDEMGKTHLSMLILGEIMKNYKDINWFIFDPNGQYSNLQTLCPDQIQIINPTPTFPPFQISLFDPLHASTDEHARKILKLIEDIFPEPFMNPIHQICLKALKKVIKNVRTRRMEHLIMELNDSINSSELKPAISRAVTDLIEKLKHLRGSIIDSDKTTIEFDHILKQKTILNFNLTSADGDSTERKFFLNLVLKYIIDHILRQNFSNSIIFLILIEDAHLLCPSILREVPETSYVSDMPRLLTKFGVGLVTVTTLPERSRSLIECSEVKFIFRTPYASKILPVSETQEQYIQKLPKREVIVTLPRYPLPFRVHTNFFTDLKIILV